MTPKAVFIREATGLVREASATDVFMILTNQSLLPFMIVFGMTAFIYLGGDFFTGYVGSIVLTLCIGMTYYLLGTAIPRTGGDYVFSSRLLHPAIGMISLGMVGWILPLTGTAFNAAGGPTTGLAPTLSCISLLTKNQGLQDIAVMITQPINGYIIASVIVILMALIVGLGGLKTFLWTQGTLVSICIIANIVAIGVVLTTSHSQFVSMFDALAKDYGTSYSAILANAQAAGFTPPPRTPSQALYLIVMTLTATWGLNQASCVYGEVKNIRKSLLVGTVVYTILMISLFFVTYTLTVAMVGYDFATAVGWSALGGGSVPVPVLLPFPAMFYLGLAANNTLVTAIIGLGPTLGFFAVTGWTLVMFARYSFAPSFDRLLPSFLSEVHERFHSPLNATVSATVLVLICMAIMQYASASPTMGIYVYYLGMMLSVAVEVGIFISALSLALMPYLRKNLYEQNMPFKRKIAGIPLATWSGAITMAIMIWVWTIWFGSPYSIVVFGGFPWFGIVMGVFAVILVIVYVAIKAYRARQGIDLSLVYKEIPPE